MSGGLNGTVYEAYDCEAAPGAAFGCSTSAPFANAAVDRIAGTAYTVDLTVDIYAHGDVSATIDPQFTAPPSLGGEFVYSPGIGAVPETTTWALMIAGLAWSTPSCAAAAPGKWRRSDEVLTRVPLCGRYRAGRGASR